MRKMVLSIMCILIVELFTVSFSYATDSIIESPDIKFFVDGKESTISDTPLIVNGKVMLPVSDLSTKIGVGNDAQHFSWNADDKSITLIKDSTKIFLKIGSKVAYKNDKAIAIDTASFIYPRNNKTYVPVDFVAQNLGKKVVWTDSAKLVLIQENSNFNKIGNILNNFNKVMKQTNSKKATVNIDMISPQFHITTNVAGEINIGSKIEHLVTNIGIEGHKATTEFYLADNARYISNPITGGWQKTTFPSSDFMKEFQKNSNTIDIKGTDAICAGLIIDDTSNPNIITLKGSVYLKELYDNIYQNFSNVLKLDIKSSYIELSIDRKTNLITKLFMDLSGYHPLTGFKNAQLEEKITCTYSDYNGKPDIVLPQKIKDNAVETKN